MNENKDNLSRKDWIKSKPLNRFLGACFSIIFTVILYLLSLINFFGNDYLEVISESLFQLFFFTLFISPFCFVSGIYFSFKSTGALKKMGLILNTSGLILFCFAAYSVTSNFLANYESIIEI